MNQPTETLLDHSIALWQEFSPDALLALFAYMLRDDFNQSEVELLFVRKKKGSLSFERAKRCYRHLSRLPDQICDEVCHSITSELGTRHRKVSFSPGTHRTKSAQFAFFGPLKGAGYIIAWSVPVSDCKLNFLAHQIHMQFRWIGKLDRTQTLVYLDDLTGLFNYRYLEVVFDAEIARAQRYRGEFSVVFLDLDLFKGINDQWGHLAGSRILKETSKILKANLRNIDVVVRYGGDEYVLVLTDATKKTAESICERVRAAVADHAFEMENGQTASLTISVGIACFPEHGETQASLIKHADAAMYYSKAHGKNRVTTYDQSIIP